MMVVDANVIATSMCLEDEVGAASRRVLDMDQEWLAPDQGRIETASAIRNLVLRRRVTLEVAARALPLWPIWRSCSSRA